MILVDANILLYAVDADAPRHERAVTWWDGRLSRGEATGLCWPTLTAFLRISTNPRLYRRPLTTEEASGRVNAWLACPCVRVLVPTSRHWEVVQRQLEVSQARADLVMDAHLAALAVQHDCGLASTDADFAKFPEVRWVNPLA